MMPNTRENLVSFIFNGIGIPVAAGVLYPLTAMLMSPMLADVAMALSFFTIVLTSPSC